MDKRTAIYNFFNLDYPVLNVNKGLEYASYIMGSLALILIGGIALKFFNIAFIALALAAAAVGGLLYKDRDKHYRQAMDFYTQNMPDVQSMEAWFSEDLTQIVKTRAFQRFELDAERMDKERYLILPVPYTWEEAGVFTTTKQKNQFYSAYWVTTLILTKNYVSVFSCIFDWLNGTIVHEETNEFFYNDIASIRTGNFNFNKALQSDKEQKLGAIYTLRIVNVSGDTMDVFSQIPGASAPLTVNIDQVVTRLRKMLRNRRIEEDPDFEIIKPNKEDGNLEDKA